MRFLDKLNELQMNLPVTFQTNGTRLVGIPEQSPPLANHYIYAPMSPKLKAKLMDSYKRNIPDQLLEIYETANGCNLFWRCVAFGGGKLKIPMAQLSVYGVPDGVMSADRIEPYNISIEDLDRPASTPENWLKIGSYREFSTEKLLEYDLFADVDTGNVYSVIRKAEKCKIEHTWESIDDCLSELFDTIQSCE